MLCYVLCGWVAAYFTYIRQDYFTGTGTEENMVTYITQTH